MTIAEFDDFPHIDQYTPFGENEEWKQGIQKALDADLKGDIFKLDSDPRLNIYVKTRGSELDRSVSVFAVQIYYSNQTEENPYQKSTEIFKTECRALTVGDEFVEFECRGIYVPNDPQTGERMTGKDVKKVRIDNAGKVIGILGNKSDSENLETIDLWSP